MNLLQKFKSSNIETLLQLGRRLNLGRIKRRFFELWGIDRFSRPAFHDLERKLEVYLPAQGFFIEAGAYSGFYASNTYYLERIKGWQGILIEPIPQYYRKCVRERPNSKVFNCALVAPDYADNTIEMIDAALVSVAKGTTKDDKTVKKSLENFFKSKGHQPNKIQVSARTLTSILDEVNVTQIDFFSLDVEGFELNVLKGLNFYKYRPKFMLIECLNERNKDEIQSYLSNYSYRCIDKLSHRDYLFSHYGDYTIKE